MTDRWQAHWAAAFIGQPWSEEHNCWWLVRRVFETQYGVTMPYVRVGDFGESENVAAIQEAARVTGFKPAEGIPIPGDIVLMRGPLGERHVGVMIDSLHGDRMLHSEGYMGAHGPVGSVMAQPLRDLIRDGYTRFEPWRRA